MGYQALLFCPDEKTARTVTQVLSELDFTVTPCTEPFAAVKKLMSERFDAVVVDCDNEQNATLLFKSARNTTNNQSALTVAVVEGQAGVAKAFRIGANLVLTKPINVEQAKGTVRVARGLLRKSEGSKSATTAGTSSRPAQPPVKPLPPVSSLEIAHPAQPKIQAEPISFPAQKSPSLPSIAASIPDDIIENIAASKSTHEELDFLSAATPSEAPKIIAASPSPKIGLPSTSSTAGSGTSSASAPAPARETRPSLSNEGRSPLFVDAGTPTDIADFKEKTQSADASFAPDPSFTFGGTVGSSAESSSAGNKKLFLVAAAVLLLAAGSYAAWTHWGHSNDSETAPAHSATRPDAAPTTIPQPAPKSAPVTASTPSFDDSTRDSSATSQPAAAAKPSSASTTGASSGKASAHAGKDVTDTESLKPSASTKSSNKGDATDDAPQPIVIKNGLSKSLAKPSAANDAPSLSITNIAPSAGSTTLPELAGSSTTAATPVLQRLNISQGVSRGLLIKQ